EDVAQPLDVDLAHRRPGGSIEPDAVEHALGLGQGVERAGVEHVGHDRLDPPDLAQRPGPLRGPDGAVDMFPLLAEPPAGAAAEVAAADDQGAHASGSGSGGSAKGAGGESSAGQPASRYDWSSNRAASMSRRALRSLVRKPWARSVSSASTVV